MKYFEQLKQLLESLQVEELTLNDLCRMLVMQTFKQDGSSESFIFELHHDATYSLVASYGISPAFGGEFENISLTKLYPSALCIRNNIVIKTTKAAIATDFADSVKVLNQPDYEHLTVFPIRKYGMPIGAVAILTSSEIYPEGGTDFLDLVGLVISSRFSHSGRYQEFSQNRETLPIKSKVLTEREALIQIQMRNGLTNFEIAAELGFSESTIRQDAVSLFSKLGVSNRREAGNLLS